MRWPRIKRDPMRQLGSQLGLLFVLVIGGGVAAAAAQPDPEFGNLFWPGLACLIVGLGGIVRLLIRYREK
jgi:hypothetical protein